jgi:hypothetical protein
MQKSISMNLQNFHLEPAADLTKPIATDNSKPSFMLKKRNNSNAVDN